MTAFDQLDLLAANPSVTLDPALGQRLKDHGITLAWDNAAEWWKQTVSAAIDLLAERGVPFTADDVKALGVPDPLHSNNAWGSAFSYAAKHRRVIQRHGFQPGGRASVHGHMISVWVGTAAARAEAEREVA